MGGGNTFSFNDCKYLTKYIGKEKSKYFDIRDLINETDVPIYHMYASQSVSDNIQINVIDKSETDISNVFLFSFREKNHGSSMYPFCYPAVLSMGSKTLSGICELMQGKEINKVQFSVHILGIKKTIIELVKRLQRRIAKSAKYRIKLMFHGQ